MDQELFLAYDGSINSDWVARYAIRLARNTPGQQLTILHIQDRIIPGELLNIKLEHIATECQLQGVELKITFLPPRKNVFATLLSAIPAGEHIYCICGARATSRGKGFLAGTVSQRLLRAHQFNTLALRVVNPGLLGCPENVMFPLSGHPRKFQAAMPFLLMLAPCIEKLTLLRIMTVNPLLFRYLTARKARLILRQGAAYVRDVMKEVARETGDYNFHLDDHVFISDDWPKEILIQAGKVQAGLILLGASDRFLQSRFYYGNKIEQILRHTPCDVGIYRKI